MKGSGWHVATKADHGFWTYLRGWWGLLIKRQHTFTFN